jgi:hypothetical protein
MDDDGRDDFRNGKKEEQHHRDSGENVVAAKQLEDGENQKSECGEFDGHSGVHMRSLRNTGTVAKQGIMTAGGD